jgi:S1-C subfamily serine protease
VPFDDDAEADIPGYRPPPHPDDRIWRHPSEMSDHPIVPLGAPSPPPHIDTPSTTARGAGRPRRFWGAYVLAGAVGAVLAGGGVVALGVGERVVERPVTERVVLDPTSSPLGRSDSDLLDGVRQQVAPAVVGIEPTGAGAPGPGSGVVVRDDGIVVTSAALVPDGTVPDVRLPDGTVVNAELVGSDPVTGLAVLDVAGDDHSPSVMAGAAELATGVTTFVLHARGSGETATGTGVVGLTHRYVGPTGTALDGIEVEGEADAAALGGAAVDQRGNVVGIVTAVEEGGSWFVAPVEVAHRVADSLLTDGAVRHCWLGIEGTDVAGDGSGSPDTTSPTEGGGTRVASVVPGSPAAQGGLRAGDVIVALDGQAIARTPDLTLGLRSRLPGDRVDVTVSRDDGSRATLAITLG